MRRSISLGVLLLFVSVLAFADSGRVRYRLELVDGRQLSSLDAPVRRGSVVTFRSPNGELTGIPAEWVVRVESGREVAVTTRPAIPRSEGDLRTGLEPGEILVLGPTGEGVSLAPATGAGAAAQGQPAMGVGSGGYGGGVSPNVVNPNLVLTPNLTGIGSDGLPRVMSSTDLSSAAGQTTVGANGFPATTPGAPTVIGPNGTPTLAPGVPGSATPVIGPNGTPVLGTGTTPVVIGPNGTPVLAQPGQSGATSSQPVIGPNGTPVLAQPGKPGSTAPAIGPNGTPVLAQPGQPGAAPPSIAPNGTPASPPPSQGASASGPPGRS